MRNTMLVQLMATAFFTRNSPTTGAILHGDPRDEADVLARFPQVTEDDADYLEDEGLAKRYDGKLPAEEKRGSSRARREAGDETVGQRAARMAEENAEADQSVSQATGLDTRGSTAFERDPSELAGSSGATAGRMLVENEDGGPASEEEAPASGKGRARGGRSGASQEDK
jgi:hypothetical protein